MDLIVDPQSKYDPKLDDQLIKKMSVGFSFASFGAEVGVGTTTLYRWLESYSSFREAYEIGYCKSLQYFESLLLDKLNSKKGASKIDYKTLSFILRTRFREIYSEKYKIDLEIERPTKELCLSD